MRHGRSTSAALAAVALLGLIACSEPAGDTGMEPLFAPGTGGSRGSGTGASVLVGEYAGVKVEITLTGQNLDGVVRGSFSVTYTPPPEWGIAPIVARATMDCLHVEGNTAWYGGTVTRSSNPQETPVGAYLVGKIVDLGRSGDLMTQTYGMTFDCANWPDWANEQAPMLPVLKGNFTVR